MIIDEKFVEMQRLYGKHNLQDLIGWHAIPYSNDEWGQHPEVVTWCNTSLNQKDWEYRINHFMFQNGEDATMFSLRWK